MSPDAATQAAQHLLAQWVAGAALTIILAILGFNEWRHRVTVDKLVAAIARAIEEHNAQDDAHPQASIIHKAERNNGFDKVLSAIHKIDIDLQIMRDQISVNTGRINVLVTEHEQQMRKGGHVVIDSPVCVECRRIIEERRGPEEKREQWRQEHKYGVEHGR